MTDQTTKTSGGAVDRRDPSDPANDETDPGYGPAMVVIGVLFVLSAAGVVHSLMSTFGM